MKKVNLKQVRLTEKQIEALLCACSEWLIHNGKFKDAETVAINKTLVKAERKLRKE